MDAPSPTWRRLLVPTLPCALGLGLFATCCLTPLREALVSADGDLALHTLLGRLMIARRGLLATDPTCFLAPGRPFVAHEWLSQVLLGASESAWGLNGPVVLAGALVALIGGALLAHARRRRHVEGPPRIHEVVLGVDVDEDAAHGETSGPLTRGG